MNEIAITEEMQQKRQRLMMLRNELADLFETRENMLSQEKPQLTALYTALIGTLQYDEYALQVAIRTLKRKSQLIQAYVNRGARVDYKQVEAQLEQEFYEYKQQLEAQEESLRAAKAILESPMLSPDDSADMKRIYRLLVKRLHPDWNPHLPEPLRDLFIRAQAAYKSCDVQELRNILLMLDSVEKVEVKQETLDDDIARLEKTKADLEAKIAKMNESFPFSYRKQLYDKEWVSQKQETIKHNIAALQEELRTWEAYIAKNSGSTVIGEA